MEQAEGDKPKTRKVRPWIAALLTLLGWGVGLFYARHTKSAIRMAVAQALVVVVAVVGLCAYLLLGGSATLSVLNPSNAAKDFVSFGISIAVAIAVWLFVAKGPRTIERGRPGRLLGYGAVWLLPLVAATLLALVMRSVIVQPFSMPSGSMRPALAVGDFFAVKKWSYGYSRFSFAPLQNILPSGRFFAKQPERGDIVAFRPPNDVGSYYVKRLIGLPGDEVRMVSGHLHINGKPVQKEFIANVAMSCDGLASEGASYRETLDNGVTYDVYECYGDEGPLDDAGPYKVPSGHFFFLGDNRDQSQDSRVVKAIGYVPYDNLIGEVQGRKAKAQGKSP